MGAQRTHLVPEIDWAVGPHGRSASVRETASAELQRQRLLTFLQSEEPVWDDRSHPELAQGAGNWVKSLRKEGERAMRG